LSAIGNCPIFRGVDQTKVMELLEQAGARIRNLEPGESLAAAGGEVRHLHVILSGSVRGEMMDMAGKVIVIEDIHPPRPVATAFVFGDQNRYPVTITANQSTAVLSIPREGFLALMQEELTILRNFLHAVSSRGQFLSKKIRFLSFSTLREKLASYLLDLAEKQGRDRLHIPQSQSQLADLFGVTRPSVGRAMGQMNREGLIRSEGKWVVLTGRDRLADILRSR